MTERSERIIAGAVALAVNLMVLAYLAQALRLPGTHRAEETHVVQLVFIEKPKTPTEKAPRKDLTPSRPTHRSKAPAVSIQDAPSLANAEAGELRDLRAEATSHHPEDSWERTGEAGRIPTGTPDPDFRPNPFHRAPPPIQATVSRMNLKMHDRSVGGMFQAMTKSAVCRDLRRALASSPASAMAILAAMDENGCRK